LVLMDDEEVVGDGIPLDLVTDAGDGVFDLLGGGLGVVRGDVVGDLCDKCQYGAACRR
jgi:hypothetical protein